MLRPSGLSYVDQRDSTATVSMFRLRSGNPSEALFQETVTVAEGPTFAVTESSCQLLQLPVGGAASEKDWFPTLTSKGAAAA